MQLVRIHQLNEGMVLARDVYDNSGRVLLFEGIELKESFITRLKELDIYAIYVENMEDLSPFDQTVKLISKEEAMKTTKKAVQDLTLKKSIKAKQIKDEVVNLLHAIIKQRIVCLCISEIQSYDSYTESHSFNVAVLSILIGVKLGLPEKDLVELGMGAILHDIGKLYLQQKLLNKSEKLTNMDFNEIKRHTQYGYDMLANVDGISHEVKEVIRDHHERINGSGYPGRLKQAEIGLFSRIVMIADVFDAMTSDRIYKQGATPYEAIKVIRSMSGFLFDPEVTKAFLATVVPYPVGSVVKLSDGQIGIVTETNPNKESELKIKLLFDEKGIMYKNNREFLLDNDTDLKVVGIS